MSTTTSSSSASSHSAVTKQIAVLSTVHVPVHHPVLTAKLASTIDHISGGRFGVNIVCGWYKPEMEMFGRDISAHDDRYSAADEWVTFLKRLWQEPQGFDFDGQFYSAKQAFSDPKPLGERPILMNAGGSDRGRAFAAQNCDLAFILPFDPRPEATATRQCVSPGRYGDRQTRFHCVSDKLDISNDRGNRIMINAKLKVSVIVFAASATFFGRRRPRPEWRCGACESAAAIRSFGSDTGDGAASLGERAGYSHVDQRVQWRNAGKSWHCFHRRPQ
jgi:hypothetical protein